MDDRTRWNERFRHGKHIGESASTILTAAAAFLPASGTALDLAGGAGRHALWLARRGLQVTLVDVSDVALELAAQRAADEKLQIETLQRDLITDGIPAGPWNVVVSCLFLERDLLGSIADSLASDGRFFMLQPTRRNLERLSKPPERFLLENEELPALMTRAGLEVLTYREGWLEEGRHDAFAVAARPNHTP